MHVVRELFVSFHSTRALVTKFLSPKLNFDVFNSFYCVLIFLVLYLFFARINLHVTYFLCDWLVVFHVFFLIIQVVLVALYIIVFFCYFIIIKYNMILNSDVGLIINFVISRNLIS